IPAAALPDAQPAQGHDARAATRPRVELRLRRRWARARDLHQLSAQEARRSRPAADQDGARGRLRAAGSADLMASLRARVLASVLLLAAAGLVLLAAVTYAEQRSFLLNRLDQSVRSAAPALSEALDRAGFRPTGSTSDADQAAAVPAPRTGPGGFRGGPGGAGPLNLPPGTYGQRRTASGTVLGPVTFNYGQT